MITLLTLVTIVGATYLATPAAAIAPVGARHPALNPDGSQLAFDWRGDIWVVPATGGRATRLTDHAAHDAFPRWSPTGDEIAFTSDRHGNGDVFVVPLDGRPPERLTFHSDWDQVCGWSPDGTTIYFSSYRTSRHLLIWAVPRSGGRPVRVTGDRGFNARVSADGRWLVYVRGYNRWWRKGYRGDASRDIWVRALDGGESWRVTSWPGNDDQPWWSPDGRAIYFQSERDGKITNLFRQDVSVSDDRVAPAGEPVKLTNLTYDGIQSLAVSRDGRWATFESRGLIYVVSTSGDTPPEELVIDCPGDLKESPVERRMLSRGATEFAFAPGEETIAFVVEGEIYAAPVKKKGTLGDAIRLTETDAREKDLDWLDEHTLVFVSDRHDNDDVFLMRSTDPEEPDLGKSRYREAVQLTRHAETERDPQVSPDGKHILYKRATGYLWLMNADGSDQTRLIDEPDVLHSAWSPDSRFIAYSITTLGHKEDIFVFELATKRSDNVSNHPNDDFHPLWSGDGKRLSWASRTDDGFYSLKYLWLTQEEAQKTEAERRREEEDEDDEDDDDDNGDHRTKGRRRGDDDDDEKEKEPPPDVLFDWGDYPDRVRTIATVRGFYWDYDDSPDGEHYALRTDVVEEMELWTVDWDGDNLRRMTSGGADPRHMLWNEESDKVRFISGGRIKEIENEEDARPKTLAFDVELTVDKVARRRQKFHEAWRLLNDGFYDASFHGVDWQAMRSKYESLAVQAVMTEDFNDVVRNMIGELNASHLGIYGPRRKGGDQTGALGFVADDSYTGPGVRVAHVVARGPLDREGRRVEAGEVILAIDGREIAAGANYVEMLDHKAGKEVDLRVAADGNGRDARTITVEPLKERAMDRLLYKEWVDLNRARVDELSGERLGYVHLPGMGEGNWKPFIADIFGRAKGKDGLILDIRGNGGGMIHDWVLTFLERRTYGYSRSRGGRVNYNALERWDGPIVLLIDETCYSDAEIFPMGFEALGLGTVVGMPTFGAVIGTNDVELIDGAGFRIPGTGWYRMDGTNLENDPVEPHIRVESPPEENLRGHDAQLERGVEECLRKLGER